MPRRVRTGADAEADPRQADANGRSIPHGGPRSGAPQTPAVRPRSPCRRPVGAAPAAAPDRRAAAAPRRRPQLLASSSSATARAAAVRSRRLRGSACPARAARWSSPGPLRGRGPAASVPTRRRRPRNRPPSADRPPSGRCPTRISPREQTARAAARLIEADASDEAARPIAATCMRSEAEGNPACGLRRVPVLAARVASGCIGGQAGPAIGGVAPSVIRTDTANGLAHLAIARAPTLLIEAAREAGAASLAVRRSTGALASSHLAIPLARADLLRFAFADAPASTGSAGAGGRPYSARSPGAGRYRALAAPCSCWTGARGAPT